MATVENLIPRITVRVDRVYGNELIYPVCDRAKAIAEIAGTKTLTRHALAIVHRLGFSVDVQQAVPAFIGPCTQVSA